MPSTPHHKRLRRVAAELEPNEPPYFVASADRQHRAQGWYWRPAGVDHAVFLAHNHIIAELALLEAIDRRNAGAVV